MTIHGIDIGPRSEWNRLCIAARREFERHWPSYGTRVNFYALPYPRQCALILKAFEREKCNNTLRH